MLILQEFNMNLPFPTQTVHIYSRKSPDRYINSYRL